MAKRINIARILDILDKSQRELVKRRVGAIRRIDLEADDTLRNHMLALDAYQKELESLITQIDEYVIKNKLIAGTERKARVSRVKQVSKGAAKGKGKGRAKPLPPAGTKLYGKYKKREFRGEVTKNGIKLDGYKKIFPSMSAAAAVVTKKKTISGWSFWKVAEKR